MTDITKFNGVKNNIKDSEIEDYFLKLKNIGKHEEWILWVVNGKVEKNDGFIDVLCEEGKNIIRFNKIKHPRIELCGCGCDAKVLKICDDYIVIRTTEIDTIRPKVGTFCLVFNVTF